MHEQQKMASTTSISLTSKPEKNETELVSKSQSNEPESNEIPEPEWVTGFKLHNIVGVITLVVLLMLLNSSIIATAIPHITSKFHSLTDVGWYGSAYQLARYDVRVA